ncbi:Uncharacterised protein [Mycobacteroides abscessus subsp. abscessus]|nr:Uncharacterised protein [Mycobacteroides abscessus subsp. abscessus]
MKVWEARDCARWKMGPRRGHADTTKAEPESGPAFARSVYLGVWELAASFAFGPYLVARVPPHNVKLVQLSNTEQSEGAARLHCETAERVLAFVLVCEPFGRSPVRAVRHVVVGKEPAGAGLLNGELLEVSEPGQKALVLTLPHG